MKILLITPFFYENSKLGSVKYLMKLCEILSDDNEVTVFTTKSKSISFSKSGSAVWNKDINETEGKIGKITVKRFETKRNVALFTLTPKILERFCDWFYYNKIGPLSNQLELALKKEHCNYDLIILSYFPFKIIYSCARILKKNKKDYLVIPLYHHNDPTHSKKFLKKTLAWSSGILELNEFSKNLFSKIYKKNVFNIKGFVPRAIMHSEKEVNDFKRKNGLSGKFIILMVNRKEPSKNYELVINSLKYIKNPNVTLLFIGEDIDKKKINSEKVVYINNASDQILSLAYSASDVLCNISLNESFGLVFLEAWSYGLAVIGNRNCEAVSCLIKNGVDGFLCNNEKELVEKIFFLKNNQEAKKNMGLAGRQRVKNEFNRGVYKKNLCGYLLQI